MKERGACQLMGLVSLQVNVLASYSFRGDNSFFIVLY